ncbi:lactate dehydrogenase [Archaeoglobales archaeon]|nr:MAG: lactate dehydrogenase [Archaeoglobales archaeon]
MLNIEEIADYLNSITLVDKNVEAYLYDETPKDVAPKPNKNVVVVKPSSVDEISKVVRYANKNRIPIVVRGGGTGLSGGAVPIKPSIVISMEKLNRILEIDTQNLTVTCEAGVTLRALIEAVERVGLSFPPHPGDESATIGGMISTNAGGVRAVKYGVMRNYVLGLEVVLPNGEVLKLGGKVIKNVTGYNLMHLIIGSEGTLCIVTKAIIRILPKPKKNYTLVIPFDGVSDAIESVSRILNVITPLAIEYIEVEAIKYGERVVGKRWVSKDGEAHLMLVIEAKDEDELIEIAEKIEKACKNPLNIFVASSVKEQRDLLEIRSMFYEGLKDEIIDIMDVSIPIAKIPEYLKRCNEVAKNLGLQIITYGHAGDGNVHQHPLKCENGEEKYAKFKKEAFKIAKELGGFITGEHGVGFVKRENLAEFLSQNELELMKGIKKLFDPNGIMNPDKVVN